MAAAEVGASRTQSRNRCIVHDDEQRAPNSTCCRLSSIPQNGSANVNEGGKDHQIADFLPSNHDTMNHKLSPDAKWWLQLEPTFQCQMDYNSEKLSTMDNESCEETEPAFLPSKPASESLQFDTVDLQHQEELFLDCSEMSSSPSRKHDDVRDYFSHDKQSVDCNNVDRLIPNTSEKASFDTGTSWSDSAKSEPWWRISDKEELALLVAQKSMELTENCDLPKPSQSIHVRGSPISCPGNLEAARVFSSKKADISFYDYEVRSKNRFSLGSLEGKSTSFDGGSVRANADKLHKSTRRMAIRHIETCCSDPVRAELLEALCHSQTRARRAEIAAQKAYDEKEHIVKLLFRQASHLFAYKQWVHMLQLESLCLQLRLKDQQISRLIPSPPWMTLENRQPGKDNNRTRGRTKSNNFYGNAVAFAVRLGLAGAGILLGWSLGWLFTAF